MKRLLILPILGALFFLASSAQASFIGAGCVKEKGTLVKVSSNPDVWVSSQISDQVKLFIKRDGVKITGGFARPKMKCDGKTYPAIGSYSAHSPSGEHPTGMGIDVVAGRTGWNGVDRLVNRLRVVNQNLLPRPYKEILYTGTPGFGRGNHAHISFNIPADVGFR